MNIIIIKYSSKLAPYSFYCWVLLLLSCCPYCHCNCCFSTCLFDIMWYLPYTSEDVLSVLSIYYDSCAKEINRSMKQKFSIYWNSQPHKESYVLLYLLVEKHLLLRAITYGITLFVISLYLAECTLKHL